MSVSIDSSSGYRQTLTHGVMEVGEALRIDPGYRQAPAHVVRR